MSERNVNLPQRGVAVTVTIGVTIHRAARRAGILVTSSSHAGLIVISVGIAVNVTVGIRIGVGIRVTVYVPIGIRIRVPVAIGVAVSVTVGIAIYVPIGIRVPVGIRISVRVGITIGTVFARCPTSIEGLFAGVLIRVGCTPALLILTGAVLLTLSAVALSYRRCWGKEESDS